MDDSVIKVGMSYPKIRVSGSIEFSVTEFSFERIKSGKKKCFSFTVKNESHSKMVFDNTKAPIKYRHIKFRSKYGDMIGATIEHISVGVNSTGRYKRVKYEFNEIIPSSHFNLRRI